MNDCRREPPLAQVLEDPLTQVLMLSDGVGLPELRHIIKEARQRMAESEGDAPSKSSER